MTSLLRFLFLGLMTWVLSCGLGLNFGAGFSFGGLTAISEIGKDNLRLNWAAGQFVSGYVVYDVTSETPVELAQVDLSAVSYTVTGLEAGATYKFRVRAKDMSGVEDANKVDLEATTRLTTDTGDLPAAGNIKLWIISNTGITKDSQGLVSLWEDQSVNGNHFKQTNENTQPLWQDNIVNGRPAVLFNGQDNFMASVFGFADAPHTAFIAFKSGGTSGTQCIFGEAVSSGIGFGIQGTTGKLSLIRVPAGTSGSNLAVGANFQIFTIRSTGINSSDYTGQIWRSSVPADVPVTVTNIAHHVEVTFGSATGGATFGGHVAELLLYSVYLEDAQREQVEQSLSTRYSIPLGP